MTIPDEFESRAARYRDLLANFPLSPIRTDEDLAAAKALFAAVPENPREDERVFLEAIADLIEAYG
jgi:hypothetical protein